MNEKSVAFIEQIALHPVTVEEAYSFFGDKLEFENQRTIHFQNLVEHSDDYGFFVLTRAGKDYWESHQQEVKKLRDQEAKEERERKKQYEKTSKEHSEKRAQANLEDKRYRRSARREWIIAILSLIVSILTFIGGILVDNDAPFKLWILSIFQG